MENHTNADSTCSASAHAVSETLTGTYALLEQQVSLLKKELSVLSKKRLEELTEKEKLAARFAALFDVLPGGVVVLDTLGQVIECNRVAENLMDDSIMGQSWRDVLQEFFISTAGDAGGILLKNGSVVSVATSSFADGNGQIVLLTDQTESRQGALLLQSQPNSLKNNIAPVYVSQSAHNIFKLAEKVAITDCSVLICGESGTGKEVLARFIHQHSRRSQQPFVAINCAAIPESMLESILFGHEKGAFTGAYQPNAGKFELANGGTLLLDEISEMSPALQVKLLRVLQEREVERLGGKKNIALDVRIIATTNRNLAQAMQNGSFREDLYYRLSVFPIFIPALRERRDDIVILAKRFIEKYSQKMHSGNNAAHANSSAGIKIKEEAIDKLLDHRWPGNVRELENVIQRALVLHRGNSIQAEDIVLTGVNGWETGYDNVSHTESVINSLTSFTKPDKRSEVKGEVNGTVTLDDELRKHEYQKIYAVVCREKGNRKATAEVLGISERTLRYKLAEMRAQGYDL